MVIKGLIGGIGLVETGAFAALVRQVSTEIRALDCLFDRVTPGGIIILNDYGHGALATRKEAKDVFMALRGQAILELPMGQGLLGAQTITGPRPA